MKDNVLCIMGARFLQPSLLYGGAALNRYVKMNHLLFVAFYTKDKAVKKNSPPSMLMFSKSGSSSPGVSPPSRLFRFVPFNILKLDVSNAISMNIKSIQIKPNGIDAVLGPLIQRDAALFGALCW